MNQPRQLIPIDETPGFIEVAGYVRRRRDPVRALVKRLALKAKVSIAQETRAAYVALHLPLTNRCPTCGAPKIHSAGGRIHE